MPLLVCGDHEKKCFIFCIHIYFGCLVPDVHQGGPRPRGGHDYEFYGTHYPQENFTRYGQENVSHHGKEILDGYVELCTTKKERILKPRNRNASASRKDAIFHLTEGLSQKRKTTNTPPTELSTV